MSSYNNFIGIDIGKFNFVSSVHGTKATKEYKNTEVGIMEFIEDHKDILQDSLIIVEATGGYELELILSAINLGYKVHRADSRKVKNFIRSFGHMAKTDNLDARALSKYGYERHQELNTFTPQSVQDAKLFRLVKRREDLVSILVSEKNRLKSSKDEDIKHSIGAMIESIEKQEKEITDQIHKIIEATSELKAKLEVLKSIPGIGKMVSFELLVLLPELGKLDRRKIAALAGVAPRSNESGKFRGYRKVGHGRCGVKKMLFLASMAARKSHSHFKEFYEKLIAKGKRKMVALTALMRKILVIANAKLKALSEKTA